MKKSMALIFAVFFSIFSFGQNVIGDVVFPKGIPSPTFTYSPSDVIPLSDLPNTVGANTMITNYNNIPGTKIIGNATYFLIDAGTLLFYLYQYGKLYTNGTTIIGDIGFYLALNSKLQLTLVVLGVNQGRTTNLLLSDDEVLTYAIACNSNAVVGPCNLNFNSGGSAVLGTVSAPTVNPLLTTGIDIGGKVFPFKKTTRKSYSTYTSATNALDMMAKYKADNPTDANSAFFFDAGTLASYIFSNPGIQDIALIFGRNTGYGFTSPTTNLTLLAIGVDPNGIPVYFNNGAVNGTLEHAYPCPNECPSIINSTISTVFNKKIEELKEAKIKLNKSNSTYNKESSEIKVEISDLIKEEANIKAVIK